MRKTEGSRNYRYTSRIAHSHFYDVVWATSTAASRKLIAMSSIRSIIPEVARLHMHRHTLQIKRSLHIAKIWFAIVPEVKLFLVLKGLHCRVFARALKIQEKTQHNIYMKFSTHRRPWPDHLPNRNTIGVKAGWA